MCSYNVVAGRVERKRHVAMSLKQLFRPELTDSAVWDLLAAPTNGPCNIRPVRTNEFCFR